jgi:hypothetical protein
VGFAVEFVEDEIEGGPTPEAHPAVIVDYDAQAMIVMLRFD